MSSSYSVIWLDRRLRIYHFAPASLPPIGSLVEVCDQVDTKPVGFFQVICYRGDDKHLE